MKDFNSTELFDDLQIEESGGEQENVVDSPESQYGGSDAVGDGQESFVDSQGNGGMEMDADAGEGGNDSDGADQNRVQKQTREDNAAIRAARLRAEQETAARMAAEADERIARSGIMNPATGRPFKNMQELEAFGAAQREAEVQRIAKQTGRSVETVREEMEVRSVIRKMHEKEQVQREAVKRMEERNDFIARDAQLFREKYPDVDVAKLERNESFRKFCGSRFGMESLAELYTDYKTIVGGAESAGRAGAESRSRRSTGSGGAGGEMLDAYQRARLDAWNRENPDMKMTAKEFLAK